MTTADEEVAWNARVNVGFNQFQLYELLNFSDFIELKFKDHFVNLCSPTRTVPM
jgi:hypothetical protein